jgi:uncharacterized protein with HEPN domain
VSDQIYLYDILSAARRAQAFLSGLSRDQFDQSELHKSAVVKQLEIIGEADRKLTPSLRDQHPEVPWPQMIGMRHRLIHDYTHIDGPIVWDTVQNDLPALEVSINAILSSIP